MQMLVSGKEFGLRKSVTLVLALAAIGFQSQGAAATQRVEITQTCQVDCLKKACDGVGGMFIGGSEFSTCYNHDKHTSVTCDKNGKCHGFVPRLGPGGRVFGVLKDLTAVRPTGQGGA